MSIVVNSNTPSIAASRALYEARADMEKAMERLSSGKRINSASDDAAGMSIASRFRAHIASLDQGVRNANDAISMLDVYDGAAAEIENMVVRVRELAIQKVNSSYDTDDIAAIEAEIDALVEEITMVSDVRANWAGLQLGDGTFATKTMQTGSTDGDEILVSLDDLDVLTGVTGAGLTDAASIETGVDAALLALNVARSGAGALRNRLEFTVSNAMNVSQRMSEALSRTEDADFAGESAALARASVLAQAGTAMLAQANQAPQYVLTLLRG